MPRIVLGTGTTQFVPIPMEGATLPIIAGIQGGWHIEVTVQFHGFDPTNLSFRSKALPLDEGGAVAYPHALLLTEGRIMNVGDHVELVGDRLAFDIDRPDEVLGRTLRVEGSIEVGQVRLSDTRDVLIVDDGRR